MHKCHDTLLYLQSDCFQFVVSFNNDCFVFSFSVSNNCFLFSIIDMLQNISGHHDTDHLRSVELFQVVLDYCRDNLVPGGSLLGKLLRGREDKEIVAETKTQFKEVKLVKPAASRSSSAEIYILATGKL